MLLHERLDALLLGPPPEHMAAAGAQHDERRVDRRRLPDDLLPLALGIEHGRPRVDDAAVVRRDPPGLPVQVLRMRWVPSAVEQWLELEVRHRAERLVERDDMA